MRWLGILYFDSEKPHMSSSEVKAELYYHTVGISDNLSNPYDCRTR